MITLTKWREEKMCTIREMILRKNEMNNRDDDEEDEEHSSIWSTCEASNWIEQKKRRHRTIRCLDYIEKIFSLLLLLSIKQKKFFLVLSSSSSSSSFSCTYIRKLQENWIFLTFPWEWRFVCQINKLPVVFSLMMIFFSVIRISLWRTWWHILQDYLWLFPMAQMISIIERTEC